MSWEDQGRQEHGWFGTGTAPEKPTDASGTGDVFGPGRLVQRIEAVAHGTIGALPPMLRARAAAQYEAGNLARLTEAMTVWSGGTRLSTDEFADRFFGRRANDPVVDKLHGAALDVGLATGHADLRRAAEKVANAMQAIGLDRWPRFLADAQARARDPKTVAAIEISRRPPDPGRDAIRPVYPVETLLGIGAAGIAGGAAAAARAAGGAILKQIRPAGAPIVNERSQTPSLTKPSARAGRPSPERKPSVKGTGRQQSRVSVDRRTHILDGEGEGSGGHRPGTGFSGKSEFPAGWSDDKIITEIESVANDPASTRVVQPNGRTRVDGIRDGVDIRVVVNRDGVSIWTAYPTNIPSNP